VEKVNQIRASKDEGENLQDVTVRPKMSGSHMMRNEKSEKFQGALDQTLKLISLYKRNAFSIPFSLKGNIGEFIVARAGDNDILVASRRFSFHVQVIIRLKSNLPSLKDLRKQHPIDAPAIYAAEQAHPSKVLGVL